MISISIVLPIHNEANNLRELLTSWNLALIENEIDHEFVLVEDGSTDGTKDLISKSLE